MTTNANGFLSIEQLDRVNLKTMANGGLPEPFDEGDVFGALKCVAIWHQEEGPVELSSDEAVEKAVDWYCTATTEQVVDAFNRLQDSPIYQGSKQLISLMHQFGHEQVEEAFGAVRNGWTPDNDDN